MRVRIPLCAQSQIDTVSVCSGADQRDADALDEFDCGARQGIFWTALLRSDLAHFLMLT